MNGFLYDISGTSYRRRSDTSVDAISVVPETGVVVKFQSGEVRMHVRRVASPPSLWPCSAPCADADYSDAFEAPVAASEDQSAEVWMRTALEGAPLLVRWFVKFGWRFVLGFRPSRSANILGWSIVEANHEWIVLEQRSRLVAAVLLLRTGPAALTWATRVRYEAKGASIVWAVVGVVHRRVVPYIISRAGVAHA